MMSILCRFQTEFNHVSSFRNVSYDSDHDQKPLDLPFLLPSGALEPIHYSVAFIFGVTFIIWEEE
jgi:hypothetical protein